MLKVHFHNRAQYLKQHDNRYMILGNVNNSRSIEAYKQMHGSKVSLQWIFLCQPMRFVLANSM